MAIVAPPVLTAAPVTPDRSDRVTFSPRAVTLDEFRRNTHIPEMSLLAANVFNNSLEAYNSGVSAAASAASSAANASAAAAAAEATQWVSGATYVIGDARWSPITKASYRRITAGAGTIDPSADTVNWSAIPNLASVYRNKHIGGDLSRNPWQRGTSFTITTSGTYTADRWRVDFDGTANITVSKTALATPSLVNGIWCTHGLKFLVNSKSGNTFIRLSQRILDVDTLANSAATLQTAILGSAAYTIPINARQSFGTGGTPSANVVTAYPTSLSVTTTLQQLNSTVIVPSISGKTLGTNNNSFLATEYNLLSIPASGFVTIVLSGLESGAAANPWEDRRSVELSLCQNYFFKTYNQGVNPGTVTSIGAITQFAHGTSNYLSLHCAFKQTMRATPNTVTVYNPETGVAGSLVSDGVDKAVSITNSGANGVTAYTNNLTTSLNSNNSAHFVADAEI